MQLTEEQIIELAPDWATHYEMQELDKPVGLVIQFQDKRYFSTFFVEHEALGLHDKLFHDGLSRGAKPISNKKFDISEYKFSDDVVKITREYDSYLKLEASNYAKSVVFTVNKDDAIALAKHFNLTSEDLK